MAKAKMMVHIHVLPDHQTMIKVRDYAEKGELVVDWWSNFDGTHIVAVSGTLNDICCIQSFIDGLNSK